MRLSMGQWGSIADGRVCSLERTDWQLSSRRRSTTTACRDVCLVGRVRSTAMKLTLALGEKEVAGLFLDTHDVYC